MNLADKTIKTLQTKNIFVDIFTDNFDESMYGFILKYNDSYLLLEHYNDDGVYNGILIFRRQDITRIRWGNNEIKSTLKTINRQNQSKNLIDINLDTIQNIIKSVNEIFKHINIRIQHLNPEWSIIGELHDLDEDTIVIKEFGTKASLDRGMLMFSISEITRIEAGGIYENNLLKIHNKNT